MGIVALVALLALSLTCPALASPDPRLSQIAGVDVECSTVPLDAHDGLGGLVHGLYYPGGAQILDHGVEVGRTTPRIVLAPHTCRWMLFHRYSRVRETMRRRAVAWHYFAHEYAHAQGYDHGEKTIGADCAAERYYMRPLMLAYGIPPVYAERLWRLARGYCLLTAETRRAKAALVEALRAAREHGATLRQLADASRLSHQRVGQLLETSERPR